MYMHAVARTAMDIMQMKAVEDLSGLAETLQTELKRRFTKYTALGTEGHNALMLAATGFDARY